MKKFRPFLSTGARSPFARRAFRPYRWLVSGSALAAGVLLLGADGAVDFHKEIEPFLVKRCSECHGPDQQKSQFRMDTRALAQKGGKSGKPGLVPGKSAESEIFHRVASTDPDEVMPPKGEKLTPDQVQLLKAWIDQGAVWQDAKPVWSFVKPVRPAEPPTRDKSWARTPIDRFILARLDQEGLRPAPEADRTTLVRRLYLDVTGLPPTPEQAAQFLKDKRADAYERLVDTLLDSPHYGEHIARWWLDLARYADSNGFQVDSTRSMWPYRDWVIRAFNRNMRFDQFTIEQIAGDLLPNASLEQRIATGFHRNTKSNDEGGGDDEEYRVKAVKDRVATTATTWLGLTMVCAECHSHKYDPITQEEYYRLYAFLNSTVDHGNSTEPAVSVPAPSVERRVAYLRERQEATRKEIASAEARLGDDLQRWLKVAEGRTNVWKTIELGKTVSTGGATFTNLADGSLLATGVNPIYDTYTMEGVTPAGPVTALLLEVLPDPSLPHEGPGRWGQTGNFILDDLTVSATPVGEPDAAPVQVEFGSASADWEQRYYRAEHALDRNPKTGWAIAPRFGQRHFLVARLKQPLDLKGGARFAFRFDFYHGNSHTIGRLRLSFATETDARLLWPLSPAAGAALAMAPAQRGQAEREALLAHARSMSPDLRRLEQELFVLNEREAEVASARYATLVMQELPRPRTTYVQQRGNFLDRGKEVTAGVPASLPQIPADAPLNRLTLAKWLVSPENPLTARVTVNRLWERFFGTGIVKTSEDFGRQGEPPSHPELLDWLATEFIRTGFDLKAIQREMLISSVYRQSAQTDAMKLTKDPYNRLLARGPRFRLDAESIRDQALLVSGLLNPEVGGPSVYPEQVPTLWKEIGFLRPEIGMDEWPTSVGSDLYRRAVYTFWRRVCTYPTFATFDAPSRDVCISRRPRTNTPLQALAGLNETTLLEASRVFAQRIMTEGGKAPGRQLEFAFLTCLSRQPSKQEARRLLAFFEQQKGGFAADPASAAALTSVGSAPLPAGLDRGTLAAWMMVANVLLNLDETLTKG